MAKITSSLPSAVTTIHNNLLGLNDGDYIHLTQLEKDKFDNLSQYTDELAQDAIGTILVDTTTIDLSYSDSTPSISAEIKPNSITSAELSNTINISEFINDIGYITGNYVSSVFGRTGIIIAQNGDYTTSLVTETSNKNYQTDNQKLFNDATSSIQTQIDGKQSTLGYTPANNTNVIHTSGNEIRTGSLTSDSFIKSGGTSSQFLKADGSIDSSTYALSSSSHDPVTLGTANGLSLSTQVLSLGLANGSNNGALSSTDWNTFNSKLSGNQTITLTGDIAGSGATSIVTTLPTINSNVGTFAIATINGKGLITAAQNISGDISTSGAVSTLATVNSNVGSFGSASQVGTFTINGKGLTTAGANVPIQITESQVTNLTTDLAAKQNTLTNPTTGVGSQIDPITYALQDGFASWYNSKMFTPTGAVSTSGTTVTSVGAQFSSSHVGSKVIINGEWRIITVFTSTTQVTVGSAYSVNYSGVIAANWGTYARHLVSLSGSFTIYSQANNTQTYNFTGSGLSLAISNSYSSGGFDISVRNQTTGLLEKIPPSNFLDAAGTAQSVSVVKTFLDGTLGFRNVANTLTSFFTNTNTASRTYTLPNVSGTVALLDSPVFTTSVTLPTSLNLSALPSYTNDAAAATGGLAIGFGYINSVTGALQRRLV